MNKLQGDIEWSMTPYSREQWAERRKRGALQFVLTAGPTWFFGFVMCLGPVFGLLFGETLSSKHAVLFCIGIISGLIFGTVIWWQCEKLWRQTHDANAGTEQS